MYADCPRTRTSASVSGASDTSPALRDASEASSSCASRAWNSVTCALGVSLSSTGSQASGSATGCALPFPRDATRLALLLGPPTREDGEKKDVMGLRERGGALSRRATRFLPPPEPQDAAAPAPTSRRADATLRRRGRRFRRPWLPEVVGADSGSAVGMPTLRDTGSRFRFGWC